MLLTTRVYCTTQDTKITVCHIQVALRSHADFARVLACVESAALVLEYFLDDATSKALYDRQLIATRDAKHLRVASAMGGGEESEEELIRMHERTRSEWQKREDDPFSEVDFAMVLKCVHPAFTLSYNATVLLSALIRELLNEVCDLAQVDAVQRRVPPELYLDDIDQPLARIFHAGESGKQIAKMALDCLERFRLRSRKGTSLTIRFRVFSGPNAAAQNFRLNPQHMLNNVARETPFAQLLPQMCKKCHAEVATIAAIYRGHQVELQTTPAALSMPTGGIVYLVSKKWWDYTRRNEARRGLLSSLRPQDAQLKSLVEGTESKVKKDFQLASPSANSHPYGLQMTGGGASPSATSTTGALRRDESLEAKRMKQQLVRSNNTSTSSLHSNHNGSSPSRYNNSNSKTSGPSQNRSPVAVVAKRQAEKERRQQLYESDSEDPSQSSAAEDDSLSQLLKQRPKRKIANGMALPQDQQSRHQRSPQLRQGDNNLSEDALSEMQQRHAVVRHSGSDPHTSPHHSSSTSLHSKSQAAVTTKSLAARNAQLMATLDAAWLGFAAISGGVRGMSEKLAMWQQSADLAANQQQQDSGHQPHLDAAFVPSQAELAELEHELLGRLEKAEELVAQTAAAKELVAQLIGQVGHARRSSRRAAGSHTLPGGATG